MNYREIYTRLINRAKSRSKIIGYAEDHHIIPRCVGGEDNKTNIVSLTAEEHYVAHQLLVKIYPNNPKILRAALMMTVSSQNHQRINNKRYAWLKNKQSELQRQQTIGSKNPQFGRRWINNGTIHTNIPPDGQIPDGWELGKLKKPLPNCIVCGIQVFTKLQRYCNLHRTEKQKATGQKNRSNLPISTPGYNKAYQGRYFITNGIVDKLHSQNEEIPIGWKKGRSTNIHNLGPGPDGKAMP